MTPSPDEAAGSAPRVRPRTVNAALAVLVASAVLLLLLAALALAGAVHQHGLVGRAAAASGATGGVVSDERSFNEAVTALTIGLAVAMAGYLAGFAIPLARGRNRARIAVWIGIGVPLVTGLFCGLGGLLFRVTVPGSAPAEHPAEARFYDELDRLSREESRAWLDVSTAGAALLLLGSLIALAVLLWAPPSSRYFRPRRRSAPQRLLPVYAYPLFPAPYSRGAAPTSPPGPSYPPGRTSPPGPGVPAAGEVRAPSGGPRPSGGSRL